MNNNSFGNNKFFHLKHNKKSTGLRIILVLFMALTSAPVLAASIGLGVSLNNIQNYFGINSVTPSVLIPIEVTKNLLIEPFFSTSTYRSKGQGGDYKVTNDTFGLGMYFTHSLNENVSQYFGAKLSNSMIGISSYLSPDDIDVWTITPLAGFKYDATQSISAAFELGISYTDGNETNCCNNFYDSDIEKYALYAGLTMRYLFK